MTLAAGLLAAPLWLAATVAAGPKANPTKVEPPTGEMQKIAIEVRGPVALVQVTRPLEVGGVGGERLLDVALPARAALVDIAFANGAKWRAADATDDAGAAPSYVDRLAARGVKPAPEPFDESTTYRFRALGAPGARIEVRYRFALLPESLEGRLSIRFPASPEQAPLPAEVAVTGADGDLRIAGEARGGGRSHVTMRGAWEVSWAPRAASGRGARLEGSLALARVSPTVTLAAVLALARPAPPAPPPASVVLLVDRSRSVGLPGLAAERDLARNLLEALPPSTRFDALFFDRDVTRLFPVTRPATREAMSAFEAEMVPDKLRNGTDLPSALRAVGELLRRETSAFAPRTLLAIITDGALPEGPDGAALGRALGAVPGVEVSIAAWIVRPKGDDEAPPAAARALRQLAAAHGGVSRAVATDELDTALPPILAALTHGGDVADVRMVVAGRTPALVDHLAPGEGHAEVVKLADRPGPLALTATAGGVPVRAPLHPMTVDAKSLIALYPGALGPPGNARSAPLVAPGSGEKVRQRGAAFPTFLLATDTLVALVEHGPVVISVNDAVRGSLDRVVVRNTLSLAFMPRARACYLSRTAATPAQRDLSGRVRLAIDLTRGEVGDVVVQSSTLNHPGIEGCLRDGAFALEVPRTLRSDAPSTAVLNLVFRPRTPEKAESAAEAALGEQIDLVIEEARRAQTSPSEDARRAAPPPAEESPAVDRSMIPTR